MRNPQLVKDVRVLERKVADDEITRLDSVLDLLDYGTDTQYLIPAHACEPMHLQDRLHYFGVDMKEARVETHCNECRQTFPGCARHDLFSFAGKSSPNLLSGATPHAC
jgi:hypothetical protein